MSVRVYTADERMITRRVGFIRGYVERDWRHEEGPDLRDTSVHVEFVLFDSRTEGHRRNRRDA